MSTPQEYRRVADELAALRTAIEALATEIESGAWQPKAYRVAALRALLDVR